MKKLPTKLKKLKGTLRKHRVLPDEVSFQLASELPQPPAHFGKIATRVWVSIIPQLQDVGILETVDLPQLEMYCTNVEIYEKCSAIIKKAGLTIVFTNKNGHSYTAEHPALRSMNNAISLCGKLATKFGFDPAARTKVASKKSPVVEIKEPFELAIESSKLKLAK